MFKFIKKFKGARSFFRLVQDPNKLDDVFKLSDNTDHKELMKQLAEGFARFPKGQQALLELRRLPRFDLRELSLLPPGTLGHEFAQHMISRGLDPAAIPTLNGQDAGEYVRAHLYETHDIWHVVTGFGTDVAGELGLQGFYMAQVHGPLPPVILSAGLLNSAFHATEEFDVRMRNITAGWRMGKRAVPFFGTYWDLYWDRPLAEVRALHGIPLEGVAPELALEAEIMNGLGGIEAYRASQVAHATRALETPRAKALAGRSLPHAAQSQRVLSTEFENLGASDLRVRPMKVPTIRT